MATLFASLKILIAYFYSRTPTPYYLQLTFLDFLHRTEFSAILVDVCLNSVAKGVRTTVKVCSGNSFHGRLVCQMDPLSRRGHCFQLAFMVGLPDPTVT